MTQTAQQLTPGLIDQLLTDNRWNLAGKMMRLALWAGMTRNEIMALTWEQITASHIVLPDRQIPLEPPLSAYLTDYPGLHAGIYILSQRTHTPVTSQGASHALRAALNTAGATDINLADFRKHYIINQLQIHPITEVGRRTGLSLTTLKNKFGDYIPKTATPQTPTDFPRQELEALLAQQGRCAASLALQLAWKGGLPVQSMVTTTWEDLSPALKDALGWTGETGYILVGPRAGNPLPPDRISRITRQLLVSNGLDDVRLRDLIADYHQRQNGMEAILAFFDAHPRTTTTEISETLGLDKQMVYRQLLRLVQQGKVVRIGIVYHKPGQVIPPQEHQALLEQHLKVYGSTFRKDIVELLGVTPNQASIILKNWVKQGLLTQEGQSYYLANTQKPNITIE